MRERDRRGVRQAQAERREREERNESAYRHADRVRVTGAKKAANRGKRKEERKREREWREDGARQRHESRLVIESDVGIGTGDRQRQTANVNANGKRGMRERVRENAGIELTTLLLSHCVCVPVCLCACVPPCDCCCVLWPLTAAAARTRCVQLHTL